MKALLLALVAIALVGGGLYASGVLSTAKEGVDKTTEAIAGDGKQSDENDQEEGDAEGEGDGEKSDGGGQSGH